MKNLQINTSPIGSQSYPLAEKGGEDIYIYGEDLNIHVSRIHIYRNNNNVENDVWFDPYNVEADQFFITDYWTQGNYSRDYSYGYASYDVTKVSKWNLLDTHIIRVRAYQVSPPQDHGYSLFSIQLGLDNQFHVIEILDGLSEIKWEDGTQVDGSQIHVSFYNYEDSKVDYQVSGLRIYLN